MRAVALDRFGGPERLRLTDLPRPRARRGEVLVRVVAAGVNPVDWQIREGLLADRLPHSFPLVPGWDLAGVVEELGEGTSKFRKGDKVWAFARKPVVQWGTYAEFTTVAEERAALMPSKYLFEEAAAVPMAGLAAFQALFDRARLREGMDVLVHAAAGGVGHFAVQLAAGAGARVYGTAGPDHQSFVAGLGGAGVIDYTKGDFREEIRRLCPEGVDVVLDTVGGDTQHRSLDVVKKGGMLVGLTDEPDPRRVAERGVRASSLLVEPSGEHLGILASMVDRGRLRAHVSRILPLADAAEAQQDSRSGHVCGKLVLAL